MKNSVRVFFIASICLVVSSCAMRLMKAKAPDSKLKPKSHAAIGGQCLALARKKSIQEHFTLRFGQKASTNVGELLIKKALLDANRFKKVHISSSSPFRLEEEDDLRSVTARLGCEMVFAYRENVHKETSYNFLSVFYPTIVGMFIFPGTNIQLGISWDVSLYELKSAAPILEGRWYGVSKLYHFRPGSYEYVSTRAYQEALANLVSRGLEEIL